MSAFEFSHRPESALPTPLCIHLSCIKAPSLSFCWPGQIGPRASSRGGGAKSGRTAVYFASKKGDHNKSTGPRRAQPPISRGVQANNSVRGGFHKFYSNQHVCRSLARLAAVSRITEGHDPSALHWPSVPLWPRCGCGCFGCSHADGKNR